MENIDNVHWHDSEIESVIELPAKDKLVYNVQYPENWEKNVYVPKSITFNGYHSQVVKEIPFEGNPTILTVSVVNKESGFTTIKIETNAGDRYVTAKSFDIGPQIVWVLL